MNQLEPRSRIAVIGLAGATLSALDTLARDGVLPFVAQWQTTAVRAPLQSAAPLTSVAAWITMVTGRTAAEHGIFDLYRKQSPEGHQLRALTSRDLPCETVWSLLNREGRKTTVLDLPLTVPPPRIEGHVLPGSWATPRQLKLGCHPSDLSKRLVEQAGVQLDALAMSEPGDDPVAWVETQIEREAQLFRALRFLRDSEPADLVLILARAFGLVYALYAANREARPKCAAYFRALDDNLRELAGTDTTLFLISEPGAGRSSHTFAVNAWLAEHGYLAWVDGPAARPSEYKAVDTDQLNRQAKLIDWERTQAYAPLAGTAAIHIAAADADYKAVRDRLAEELLAAPEVHRVWKREDLYEGPHIDIAPDLVIETKPGVAISPFSSAPDAARFDTVPDGSGGALLANGPQLRHGISLPPLSILDVAPLLCYCLGLPIPADLKGAVPVEAIDPGVLAASPVQVGPGGAGRAPEERVLDPQAETVILKRLQDLGYLE